MKSSTFLVYILVFLLVGCNKISGKVKNSGLIISTSNYEQKNIKEVNLDSIFVAKRLGGEYPSYSILVDGEEKAVPFLITPEFKIDATPFFQMNLAGMEIKNNELMYIEFSDMFSINHIKLNRGYMFFLPNKDESALSINKILVDIQKDFRIIYCDAESLIYTDGNEYYSIYLKYIKEKEQFAFYYIDTAFRGMNKDSLSKEDFIVESLRIPKMFFTSNKKGQIKEWKDYKLVLAEADFKLVSRLRNELLTEIRTISKEDIKEGKNILLVEYNNDISTLWRGLYKGRIGDGVEFDRSLFTKSIFNTTTKEDTSFFIDYKDKNTIVLKAESLKINYEGYIFLKKGIIDRKQLLILSSKVLWKETFWLNKGITMFYLRMLESLPEIKDK